jgi:hypothetical protein
MKTKFTPRPYPSYVQTRLEQIYWNSLEREREVIRSMQKKIYRSPIRSFFWRKPWRAPSRPVWHGNLWRYIGDFFSWIRVAHDCQDPAVGCSCHPSFRFPSP